jgi:Asp-tRNA(Asn)/Glu-tRNA(Gln) amidotransferase A subunit family amidase
MRFLYLLLSMALLTGRTVAQDTDSIAVALELNNLHFDKAEIDTLRRNIANQQKMVEMIRESSLPNDLSYSLVFMPPINEELLPETQAEINWGLDENVSMPADKAALAFYPVHQLATLIRSRKISSAELTQLFIDRLRQYGDTLESVITITDSLAMAQARRADAELAQGIYRGPLHGIPYGAKDLLAVKGYKTTWGAGPYQEQTLDYDATVVQKLEEAGAVLVAKLTLGALAMGDIWYGGKTRNPWDLTKGSSGSSAGSAAATVAGLVPFAIGSETLGSIVSPSTRCGATGLRPTFGRVSRHGAMALSWTMDKLGPICRNATDCALVLEAIRGADRKDLSVRDFPFNYDHTQDVKKLRVGVLRDEINPDNSANYQNDSSFIALMEAQGIELIDKKLPSDVPAAALRLILLAETGAAFDELTRTNRDSLLVRQDRYAWPTTFRASRLIPAVEYIQANRLRSELTRQFNEMMQDIDVLIAPSFGIQLTMTNLTGHPCIALPNGSYAKGENGTITLIGNHFDEASILRFARFVQEITPYEEEQPPLFR